MLIVDVVNSTPFSSIYTNGKIRQMYINEKGIDLTTSTINNQRKRWIMIDGELYDKNKTWLIPKKEELK